MKTKIISLITAFVVAIILAGCSMPGGQSVQDSRLADVDGILKTFGSDETVTAIACSEASSFVLTSNGYLYAAGYNRYGQLGLGNNLSSESLILTATNVKAVACGNFHTLILKDDGYVYAAGLNDYGQLGLGNYDNQNTWQQTGLSNVKAIACGYRHSLAVSSGDYVYSTGYNRYGQLGLGHNNDQNTWQQTGLSGVYSIACGQYHSLALLYNGRVYSTGYNGYGQLGLGNSDSQNTWQQTGLSNVKAISCGLYHSLALDYNGNLYGAGYNKYGQLGLGDNSYSHNTFELSATNIISAACGGQHSLAVKNDGFVYATGYNRYGQLGNGSISDRNTWQTTGSCITVACGAYHSFALTGNGYIYSTGRNSHGQLGIGNSNQQNTWQQLSSPYNPPNNVTIRLRNLRTIKRYINIEDQLLCCAEAGVISAGWLSAKWYMSKNNEGYYIFKSAWTGASPNPDGYDYYLHMEDYYRGNTAVEYGANYDGAIPDPGWWSAQWSLEPVFTVNGSYNVNLPNCYRLKNRWTKQYIWIEPMNKLNNPKSVDAVELNFGNPFDYGDTNSAKWYIEIVN